MPRCILQKLNKVSVGMAISYFKVISWEPPPKGNYPLDNHWTLLVRDLTMAVPGISSSDMERNGVGGGDWTMPSVGNIHLSEEVFAGLAVYRPNAKSFTDAVLNFNRRYSNNSNIEMEDIIWEES